MFKTEVQHKVKMCIKPIFIRIKNANMYVFGCTMLNTSIVCISFLGK